MKKSKIVVVAMSGGIDSSIAAFLLKEQGYRVEGIYFRLINDENSGKSRSQSANPDNFTAGECRAERLAQQLNIPLHQIDYRNEFKQIIINDFIRKYQKGITPNPCILCNEKIKFRLLLDYAIKNDIPWIATGHYVRIKKDQKQNRYILRRGLDTHKDQSYFLYRLSQDVLSRSILPLGSLMKNNVEKIARKIGLKQSSIKESQEICFIAGNNYRELIEHEQGEKPQPGYFLDTSGNILGKHRGIAFYTVGQRKKTGLSLNTRKYIIRINAVDNTIVIGDDSDLYQRELRVEQIHFISPEPLIEPIKLLVQIRYQTPPAPAIVFPCQEERLRVLFDEPQRAITPGQSAVFYNRNTVVGGGIISLF